MNSKLGNLSYLLLVQDAVKADCTTVRTTCAAGTLPVRETRVAEMLAAALGEAGALQDLGTDAADIFLRDLVNKLVVVASVARHCRMNVETIYIESARNSFQPRILNNAHLVGKSALGTHECDEYLL